MAKAKSKDNRYRHSASISLALWSGVLVACIALLIFLFTASTPKPPTLPDPPKPAVIDRGTQRGRFFDEKVQPAIAAADKANREAMERCLQRLRDTFGKYREGIGPFADDLTTWGTRFGILRRMPSDWWYKNTDAQKFVAEKFEARLFSEQSLKQPVENSIKQFNDDVHANNNTLLANIQAALSKSDLPLIPKVDYGNFSSDVTRTLQEFSGRAAKDSVTSLLLAEIASGVGTAAATRVVSMVVAQLAVWTTEAAAMAGGETAVGATLGGGGGSVVGPIGTAVGFCVGVATGLGIDWWMTSKFKTRLSVELNEMIDQLESSVIQGTASQPGLSQALSESCDALRDAYRDSFFKRIVQESNK
jgi:hypothetical protein